MTHLGLAPMVWSCRFVICGVGSFLSSSLNNSPPNIPDHEFKKRMLYFFFKKNDNKSTLIILKNK